MRWIIWAVDVAGFVGLALTTIGMCELGRACGVGAALGWLWTGAWLMGLAIRAAIVLGRPRKKTE